MSGRVDGSLLNKMKCFRPNVLLLVMLLMEGWMDGWMDGGVYFLEPAQTR